MTFKISGMFHCINCFLPSGKQKFDHVGKNLFKISWCPKSVLYDIFHIFFSSSPYQPKDPTLCAHTEQNWCGGLRDLKKVVEHYPVGISRAWTQWLQDVNKLLELPTDWEWPLDILKRCSKVQRPANEDIIIPDHLQAMREKETVETQQVWLFVYGKWCLVLVLWVKQTHRFSRQAQLTCTL